MEKYNIESLEQKELNKLDRIKQQTLYKVKFVFSYAREWLFVSSNRKEIKTINFIDCMCNAGVYEDGNYCSCIEVINIVINEFANKHKEKEYNIFLNDNDEERILILTKIINSTFGNRPNNINIYIKNVDVNDYLQDYKFENRLNINNSTLLFVDPYNLGTVSIDIMANFVNDHYCDLLFNYFVSDYVRNGIDKKKLLALGIHAENEEEVFLSIKERLKRKNIKYVYTYGFKTTKNMMLYELLFATPNIMGLVKLKNVIWNIFNGARNYQNFDEREISLFSTDEQKQLFINDYSKEIRQKLVNKYSNKTLSYSDIEEYILLESPLMSTHIINNVIKPLQAEGFITKNNLLGKNNFKKDTFYIKGN